MSSHSGDVVMLGFGFPVIIRALLGYVIVLVIGLQERIWRRERSGELRIHILVQIIGASKVCLNGHGSFGAMPNSLRDLEIGAIVLG